MTEEHGAGRTYKQVIDGLQLAHANGREVLFLVHNQAMRGYVLDMAARIILTLGLNFCAGNPAASLAFPGLPGKFRVAILAEQPSYYTGLNNPCVIIDHACAAACADYFELELGYAAWQRRLRQQGFSLNKSGVYTNGKS